MVHDVFRRYRKIPVAWNGSIDCNISLSLSLSLSLTALSLLAIRKGLSFFVNTYTYHICKIDYPYQVEFCSFFITCLFIKHVSLVFEYIVQNYLKNMILWKLMTSVKKILECSNLVTLCRSFQFRGMLITKRLWLVLTEAATKRCS